MTETTQEFKDKTAVHDVDSWEYALNKIEEGQRRADKMVKKFVQRGDELFGKPKVPEEFL